MLVQVWVQVYDLPPPHTHTRTHARAPARARAHTHTHTHTQAVEKAREAEEAYDLAQRAATSSEKVKLEVGNTQGGKQ